VASFKTPVERLLQLGGWPTLVTPANNRLGSILDESDFYPFGGERVISASRGNAYKFTGKERDTEFGLDNFERVTTHRAWAGL
jgi:hypothetical protein